MAMYLLQLVTHWVFFLLIQLISGYKWYFGNFWTSPVYFAPKTLLCRNQKHGRPLPGSQQRHGSRASIPWSPRPCDATLNFAAAAGETGGHETVESFKEVVDIDYRFHWFSVEYDTSRSDVHILQYSRNGFSGYTELFILMVEQILQDGAQEIACSCLIFGPKTNYGL